MSNRFRRNATRSFFMSLWAAVTLILLIMVVLLVREIADNGRNPIEAFSIEQGETAAPSTIPAPDRTLSTGARAVQLFFASQDGRFLVPEPRSLPLTESTLENCRVALDALIKGPGQGGTPILPPLVTVKAIYLLPQGELVINFSRELQSEYARLSSATVESLFAQGVAHTVAQAALQNSLDPKVRKVRILVEDAPPTEAFPAHIDLSEPIAPEAQWLATEG